MKRTVTVCDNCLRASCWQGMWMCEKARDAGIREMSVEELQSLRLEDPSYWEAGGVYDYAKARKK